MIGRHAGKIRGGKANQLVNTLRSRVGTRLRFAADRLDPAHAPRWSGFTFQIGRDGRPIFYEDDRRSGCKLWYLGHDERTKAFPFDEDADACFRDGGHYWAPPLDGQQNVCLNCGFLGALFDAGTTATDADHPIVSGQRSDGA